MRTGPRAQGQGFESRSSYSLAAWSEKILTSLSLFSYLRHQNNTIFALYSSVWICWQCRHKTFPKGFCTSTRNYYDGAGEETGCSSITRLGCNKDSLPSLRLPRLALTWGELGPAPQVHSYMEVMWTLILLPRKGLQTSCSQTQGCAPAP